MTRGAFCSTKREGQKKTKTFRSVSMLDKNDKSRKHFRDIFRERGFSRFLVEAFVQFEVWDNYLEVHDTY